MTTITPYDAIGGEQTILSLVDRFYFYMDILPDAQGIRSMHQPNLDSAKAKLFKFLSGWGWPQFVYRRIRAPDAARAIYRSQLANRRAASGCCA